MGNICGKNGFHCLLMFRLLRFYKPVIPSLNVIMNVEYENWRGKRDVLYSKCINEESIKKT